MKFLIDENVEQSVIKYLEREGYDIIVATSGKFKGREDLALLEHAFKENRIIITNDKDFGYLVFRLNLLSRGIILFRFTEESPSLKIAALETILSKDSSQILNHFIVVSEDKIRSRPLTHNL